MKCVHNLVKRRIVPLDVRLYGKRREVELNGASDLRPDPNFQEQRSRNAQTDYVKLDHREVFAPCLFLFICSTFFHDRKCILEQ
jgi:hypothetical protein